MSNEQLLAMLGQSGPAAGSGGGLSSVPTEQLMAMLGQQAKPEEAIQQRGPLDELGRQLGLTGRYAIEGAGNLYGMLADPIGQTLDAATARKNVTSLVTGEESRPLAYEKAGDSASRLADWLGLPKPEGSLENAVAGASKALVGTGLTAGLGSAAPALGALAEAPAMQAASAALGGAAPEIAKDAGAGEGGQIASGVIASLLPGAGAAGASGLRYLARGGEEGRQRMLQAIADFSGIGSTPTVAQAAQTPYMRTMEALLSKAPGGHGPMVAKAEEQAGSMSERLGALADSLAPGTNPTKAGRAIEQGITGKGGFVDRFKGKARELYDALDQHMPGDTAVPMRATDSLLTRMAQSTRGAEATSALLANPKLGAIREALASDMQGGALPYQAVKQLRTRVGEMIADAGLVSDVPRGELKQLYGALSQDIRNQAAKDPKAFAAANRAENYYRAGMDRLDRVESVVAKSGGPEKIFQAAMSGTREGATTLRAVMQSLGTDESKMVSSAVIRRLGRANPSAQNDVGDAFSTETFLSNWNGMSSEAKQTLFNRMGPSFRNDMDRIAKVAANLREGNQVFRNPSGTAAALGNQATAASVIIPALMGHPGTALAVGGAVGAANIGAKAMTSPTVVKWLAQQTTKPAGLLPAQIAVLANAGKVNDDQEATDLAAFLAQAGSGQ